MVTAKRSITLSGALYLLALLTTYSLSTQHVNAQVKDPFDFTQEQSPTSGNATDSQSENDEAKSADTLIDEADALLNDERLIDARTKLLAAIKKDPKSFKAHLLLSSYYMENVGHFRLALRYVLQAQKLFIEKYGEPPYENPLEKNLHSKVIYLLAQAYLNLDEYSTSLQVLDQYSALGYNAAWYPSTRAWVLMKLGRIEEAIKVAKVGLLAGAEPGRTLNMLGILLSMHDEREESLQIFREAIRYELSAGDLGQPATPLNNSGEVYKELFQEDKAESNWLRATSMADGCEHILPSLNLTLLYLDELNLEGATQTLDRFDACIAQYPLKNGEEHKSLEKLARGRIELLSGRPERALPLFEDAVKNQQWFGKIGTDPEDLRFALTLSLAQTYRALSYKLASTIPTSFLNRLENYQERATLLIKEKWYLRKARIALSEELNDGEDIEIKNTDSLIEYPTFGELLSTFPEPLLERKLAFFKRKDSRPEAQIFYDAYAAEQKFRNNHSQGEELLRTSLSKLRDKYDSLFQVHLLALYLKHGTISQKNYNTAAFKIYSLSRAAIRNYGLRIYANVSLPDPELQALLGDTPFTISAETSPFKIVLAKNNGGYTGEFRVENLASSHVRVSGRYPEDVLNKLSDAVFSQ